MQTAIYCPNLYKIGVVSIRGGYIQPCMYSVAHYSCMLADKLCIKTRTSHLLLSGRDCSREREAV